MVGLCCVLFKKKRKLYFYNTFACVVSKHKFCTASQLLVKNNLLSTMITFYDNKLLVTTTKVNFFKKKFFHPDLAHLYPTPSYKIILFILLPKCQMWP